jgi:hypothetical protein
VRTSTILIIVLASVAGAIVVTACVRVIWRLVGVYLIQRAGPRKLRATKEVLWRDPGRIEDRDLATGPGGADGKPVPPFTFAEEHQSGSNPCVSVRDAKGHVWRVKWGEEVQSETFAVRLAWAVGYFAEVTHYVAEGTIAGARDLQRANACLDEQGRFSHARFELEDERARTHWEEHSWAWNDNPFVGTPELNGLKILVMLLSNWDSKDQRDVARGSNTGIFEYTLPGRRREARYLITDWGGSMGRWGTLPVTRANWNPDAFEAQTPRFITGVTPDGIVEFGYAGQRTADVSTGIRVEDVRWLHGYLGRVTDRQIMDALHASGASTEEAERYTAALRERIDQLGEVARAASDPSAVRP